MQRDSQARNKARNRRGTRLAQFCESSDVWNNKFVRKLQRSFDPMWVSILLFIVGKLQRISVFRKVETPKTLGTLKQTLRKRKKKKKKRKEKKEKVHFLTGARWIRTRAAGLRSESINHYAMLWKTTCRVKFYLYKRFVYFITTWMS